MKSIMTVVTLLAILTLSLTATANEVNERSIVNRQQTSSQKLWDIGTIVGSVASSVVAGANSVIGVGASQLNSISNDLGHATTVFGQEGTSILGQASSVLSVGAS